jgi:hypothetical protein
VSKTVSSRSLGRVDGDNLGFGALDGELEPPLAASNGVFPMASISHQPAKEEAAQPSDHC